jgi:hypothetical protein
MDGRIRDELEGNYRCLIQALNDEKPQEYGDQKNEILPPCYLFLRFYIYRYQGGSWLWDGVLRGRISSPGIFKHFRFSIASRAAVSSTQLHIQWVPGTLSLELKRLGRETDHLYPTIVEVK